MTNPPIGGKAKPVTKITADVTDTMVYALAKQGFYAGNPTLIWEAPVNEVIDCYNFNIFTQEYANAEFELNKPG